MADHPADSIIQNDPTVLAVLYKDRFSDRIDNIVQVIFGFSQFLFGPSPFRQFFLELSRFFGYLAPERPGP
jgi:hypothetical protein